MPPAFSLYLDAVRFLAALAVLLDHVTSEPFAQRVLPRVLGDYGDVAVTLFFVLSGYVIGFVTSTREQSATSYWSARLARLYSVVPLALALTFILDRAGMIANPSFYSIQRVLWRPESVVGYLSSLFFLNEYQIFHFGGIAPGTNGPIWSLSFEATYYVIAGLILFMPRRFSVPAGIVILYAAGRTITAMFPLWLMGFVLSRYGPRLSSWPSLALLVGIAVTLFGIVEFGFAESQHVFRLIAPDNFGYFFPWGREPFNRDLLLDYGVAFLFCANLLMAREICARAGTPPLFIRRLGRSIGDFTFPLYAMHYPMLCFLGSVSPWPAMSWANLLFLCIPIFLTAFAAVFICDGLKKRIRAVLAAPEQTIKPA